MPNFSDKNHLGYLINVISSPPPSTSFFSQFEKSSGEFLFFYFIFLSKLHAQLGAPPQHPEIKHCMFYPPSQPQAPGEFLFLTSLLGDFLLLGKFGKHCRGVWYHKFPFNRKTVTIISHENKTSGWLLTLSILIYCLFLWIFLHVPKIRHMKIITFKSTFHVHHFHATFYSDSQSYYFL